MDWFRLASLAGAMPDDAGEGWAKLPAFLAVAIVLCPLIGFCFKVLLQTAGVKYMWALTDKICVLMMCLAFGMSLIIGYHFLLSDDAGDDEYVNRRYTASWLVFGKNDAERYLNGLGSPGWLTYKEASVAIAGRRQMHALMQDAASLEVELEKELLALDPGSLTYVARRHELEERLADLRHTVETGQGHFEDNSYLTPAELDELEKVCLSLAVNGQGAEKRPDGVVLKAGAIRGALHSLWRDQHLRWEVSMGVEFSRMTVLMLLMVTFIATLIHIYATGYMHGDPRYPRFFSYISLFAFGMLGLVVADSLLLLYMFWEIMGLCSYLLIGFYFEKESAAAASLKAFMTTRIGDVAMFIGMMMIFAQTGTFSFMDMYESVGRLAAASDYQGLGWITAGTIMLFMGPVGKSAQFPLHVWLPDAMEGPTPVSAMIHAATMVSGGVLLTGKIFPMMTPQAMDIVACVGGFTALFAATIAITQNDIKKVLAYSTISQLGFMICAIGCGAWVAAMFHMLTHAFFKACMFLGAGSVIHAVHTNDMREMGGLWKKMPLTFITFLVSTCSIAGVPFFAGFVSKDMIIKGTLFHAMSFGDASLWRFAFFGMLWVAAGCTAFYMFRLVILTFFGHARDHHKYDHAHESPFSMTFPLLCLGLVAVIGGYSFGRWNVEEFLKTPKQYAMEASYGAVYRHADFRGVDAHGGHGFVPGSGPALAAASGHGKPAGGGATHDTHGHAATDAAARDDGFHHMNLADRKAAAHLDHRAHSLAMMFSIGVAAFGIGMAFLFYLISPGIPAAIAGAVPWAYQAVLNKYYIDELYQWLFIKPLMNLCVFLARWIDMLLIDGIVNSTQWFLRGFAFLSRLFDTYVVDGAVNMVGEAAQDFGDGMSHAQTGKVQQYVIGIVAGVVVIGVMIWALGAPLSGPLTDPFFTLFK